MKNVNTFWNHIIKWFQRKNGKNENGTWQDGGKHFVAFNNGKENDEMDHTRKTPEILLALSRQASAETNLNKLLFYIVERLLDIIPDSNSSSIYIVNQKNNSASIQAWAGFAGSDIEGLTFSLDNSIVGKVVKKMQPVIINDTDSYVSFLNKRNPSEKVVQSTMAAPIVFQNQVIGAMFVDNREKKNAFSKGDIDLLESIANQLAGNIANAKLLSRIQEQRKHLLKEQKRARNYLDIAQVIITTLDRSGRITMVNHKGTEIFGYQESEMVGQNWFDLCVPEEKREIAVQLYEEFFLNESETGPEFDQFVITKSGQRKILRACSTIIRDENGEVIGTLNSGEDVTDRVKADEALRQYKNIVSSSSDMMAMVDLDCIYVSMNDAYSSAFGMTPDELIGKHPRSVFGEEFFYNVINPHVERCFTGEEVIFQEWIEFPKTGKKYMDIHYYPYRDREGNVIGLVANRRDITEEYRTLATLKDSEEKNRNIIENSTNLFYTHDIDGKITFVSPQSTQILGYSPDELNNNMLWTEMLADQAKVEKAQEMTKKMIASGTPAPPYELELIHKNGRKLWVEVRESPLIADGETISVIGSLNDITARKLSDEEKQLTIDKLEIARSDIKESYESILDTMEKTIRTISRIVEVRDPYTAGHHLRVSILAKEIASQMHLDNEVIKAVELAGIIHDLGKIQIPAEILSKPGKLTDIEFNMVKAHPTVGYKLLKDNNFPWPLADIIYQHHEKLDGSGYPLGLREDEIAIESRILAVADEVEAMASHRPYRPALGINTALKQINKDAGVKLDKNVVQVCNDLFKNGFTLPE